MGFLKDLKQFIIHGYVTKPMNILVLGLSGAGKTKMLANLGLGVITQSTPFDYEYEDFILESVQFQSISFRSWDIDYNESQHLWNHYYKDVHIIVFVIDANDKTRLQEAKTGLESILKEDELRKKPLLVLANKTDLKSIPTDRIIDELGLERLRKRTWVIKRVCAKYGDVLYKGVNKLLKEIEKNL